MLLKHREEVARALPKHLNSDRMARIALSAFRRNPKLAQCDPRSVFAAVIMASQLGWEIGVGGQAYLVPYKRECQLVPGWQGLMDLVFRAGRGIVSTGAVYDGDEFDFSLGDMPYLRHKPSGEINRELQAVYAVGRIFNLQGQPMPFPIIEVWSVAKLREHRDRYNRVGNDHYSFENFEMYGRKVALLQVLKYVPKSVELQTALQLEHSAADGAQNLTYSTAIDGSWSPEEPEEGDEGEGEPAKPRSATQEVKDQLKARRPEGSSGENDIWPRKEKPEGAV